MSVTCCCMGVVDRRVGTGRPGTRPGFSEISCEASRLITLNDRLAATPASEIPSATSHPALGDPWQMPGRDTVYGVATAARSLPGPELAVGVGGDKCRRGSAGMSARGRWCSRRCRGRARPAARRAVGPHRSPQAISAVVTGNRARALFGQAVLVAGRVLGVGAAFEDPVVGEFVQPGGQHAAGDGRGWPGSC